MVSSEYVTRAMGSLYHKSKQRGELFLFGHVGTGKGSEWER